MKVGDMVRRDYFSSTKDRTERCLWTNICVIIRGPYEKHITTAASAGKAMLQVKKVIDVLYDGEIRVACNMSDFVRVNTNEI
jgi:hypothetical protein